MAFNQFSNSISPTNQFPTPTLRNHSLPTTNHRSIKVQIYITTSPISSITTYTNIPPPATARCIPALLPIPFPFPSTLLQFQTSVYAAITENHFFLRDHLEQFNIRSGSGDRENPFPKQEEMEWKVFVEWQKGEGGGVRDASLEVLQDGDLGVALEFLERTGWRDGVAVWIGVRRWNQ